MDCLEFMRSLPDGCVDLIVTSPPYNKNAHASANVKPWKGESWSNMRGRQIAYDVYSDDMPQEQYEAWQKDVISECLRILKDTGSLFYNHKDIISEGRIIPPRWVYDFPVHQQLIWERPGTPALDPHYFFPVTEYIYWFVKDPKKAYFNRDNVAQRSSVWRFNLERNAHPAPFPLALVQKCIASSAPPYALVYDPFMGSGTTAIAVIQSGEGREFIGTEISPKYVEMANERIRIESAQLSLF